MAQLPVSRREWRRVFVVSLFLIGLSSLPYAIARSAEPAQARFNGFLINPIDGHSYLAKMRQGERGEWLFHLPFTPEWHEGAFIFTFYLGLGHLARVTALPLVWIFHLARAGAGLFLLLASYRFIAHFTDDEATRLMAFVLLAISSGLGWLTATVGYVTADLWVTEALTFPTLLANPHFPLAIGLMLLIFAAALDTVAQPAAWQGIQLRIIFLGLALSFVLPFAVPVVLAVLGLFALSVLVQQRPWQAETDRWWHVLVPAVSAGLGAAPLVVYDAVVYARNPALKQWSAQNVTASLPPWDYALGYGVLTILAVGGLAIVARRRSLADLLLLAWLGAVAVLLYLPFALQRRFITGFHVPLALVATLGLTGLILPHVSARWRRWVTGGLVGFSALSNLFLVAVSLAGVAQGSYPLCATRGEAAAFNWLAIHASPGDLVLAAPDTGLFIPGWAGNRVVYGHPFETIDAERRRREVASFFSGAGTSAQRDLLARYDVEYLFVGPRERALGGALDPAALELAPVYQAQGVQIYRAAAIP